MEHFLANQLGEYFRRWELGAGSCQLGGGSWEVGAAKFSNWRSVLELWQK